MSRYRIVREPTLIPVPGGKRIAELFGRVNTNTDGFSLAHMIAPPGWDEPAQCPEFGELTIVIRGTMSIDVYNEDGSSECVEVTAGQAFWSERGTEVRYQNRHDDECEYYAVCMPAFTLERAHRRE